MFEITGEFEECSMLDMLGPFELRNSNIKLIEGEKESHQRPALLSLFPGFTDIRILWRKFGFERCQQGQKSQKTPSYFQMVLVTFSAECTIAKEPRLSLPMA